MLHNYLERSFGLFTMEACGLHNFAYLAFTVYGINAIYYDWPVMQYD